ncbi:hypothetical protein EVB55_099 [Rhizobium phage RHph_Y68]|uniref:Uncharacterized protein n=1 Tax=Rhizobium phage RHph_Y68 TaxID=2509787 RepID=A0A7S5USX4_9CAUD|nr:hypothetical protein PP934_gp099 [Rhizobium phage RHph_Y68]QIG68034.1 hypothetical protein EVB55_099 [Rhizobium phage RHph_Y68]
MGTRKYKIYYKMKNHLGEWEIQNFVEIETTTLRKARMIVKEHLTSMFIGQGEWKLSEYHEEVVT